MAMLHRSLSIIERVKLAWRQQNKLNALGEFLVANWKVRLVSLLLALGFWVYVQLRINTVTVILSVPVGVKVREQNEAMVYDTNKQPIHAIAVNIMCPPVDQGKLRDDDFVAQVDLSDKGAETKQIVVRLDAATHIKYKGPPQYASVGKIASFSPDVLLIDIESSETKLLAVKPDLSGEPAEGFAVSDAVAIPSTIVVKGPSKILGNLDSIRTERIDIGNLDQSLRRMVRICQTNLAQLQFEQSNVEIQVAIVARPIQWTFSGIDVLPLGTPSRGRAVHFSSTSVSVILQGPKEVMEKIDSRDIRAYVNVNELSSSGFEMQVRPLPPPNCNVVSVMPGEVTVTLSEEP